MIDTAVSPMLSFFQTNVTNVPFGYTMALFNILVQWHGLWPANDGFVHLLIAEFSFSL